MTMSSWEKAGVLIVSILLVAGAAAFGSQYGAGEWYRALHKPAFTPPAWVFGPVWSLLYLGMAVAAWLVWLRRQQAPVAAPLAVYLMQLLLNALWSWIFFGQHALGWAFAEILLLDAAILATVILFWRVRALSGALLIPYVCWVSFAAILNYALWRMNAGA